MTETPETPVFVMQRELLGQNLGRIASLRFTPRIRILHAIKSFHSHEGLREILGVLDGASIGNTNELETLHGSDARYIHTYAPVFRASQAETLAKRSDSMSFNSLSQWRQFAREASLHTSVGIRINPRLTLRQPRYCNPNYSARLGISRDDLLGAILSDPGEAALLEGLHFHVFCDQGIGGLKYLLSHIEKYYSDLLPRLRWLNLGGGHAFDRYEREAFEALLDPFIRRYPGLTVLFEPGSSVVRGCGYLLTSVVDIIESPYEDITIAVVDTSIETHLLDVAITRISPKIRSASPTQTPCRYRIAGMSCLAGDIIGEYSFDHELSIGEQLIIEDMIGYTIVKQTTFNGIDNAKFTLI